MQCEQNQIVLTPALRELFEDDWRKYRVIYFGAPCGFGKTTAARALMAEYTVCERSAMQPDELAQPIPAGCDAIMVDDVQMLRDAADQQAVCAWINENPGRRVVLLGRGGLPGWLMPYQLTGLLMQIESAQLRFDRAAAAALLELNGVEPSAEVLTSILNDSKGYPLAASILCRRLAGGRPYSDRLVDEARRDVFFHFETAVYRRFTPPISKLRDSGEESCTRGRHRDWFLVWAEQGEPGIWGPEAPEFLEQLELNYNDLWAAMEWCRDTHGETYGGLRLWAASVGYYDLRGRAADGIAMARSLLAQSAAQTQARARTLLQIGVLLRGQGDLDGARAVVTECLSFAQDLGDTFDSIAALCTMGSLRHIEGKSGEAEALFKRAVVLARNCFESEPRVLYISLFWLGSFECFQGRHAQAVTILEQALQAARQQSCVLFEARILAVLGRALVGTGDYERAESILTEGIFTAGMLKYHEIAALCLDYLGQAAWDRRRRPVAIRFLAAARLLRKHVGVVYWFPDCDYLRMTSAISESELLKAAPPDCLLPEQATAWALEILGGHTESAPDRESGKLTLREREVCSLVTQGLGNREIAEKLRVSRRTVDAHIRHVLVKLDLNTRAQISAWYVRHCGAPQ